MAIDPRLQGFGPPASPSPPVTAYPKPFPAFFGTFRRDTSADGPVETVNVSGFNFPVTTAGTDSELYKRSTLFEAFRRTEASVVPSTPTTARTWSHYSKSAHHDTPGFASRTARAMAELITPATSIIVAAPPVDIPPAIPTTPPLPTVVATAPIVIQHVVASPAAPAAGPILPGSRPMAKQPVVEVPTAPAVPPILPGSRPMANAAVEKVTLKKALKQTGGKAPSKKVAAATSSEKQGAAKAAQKVASVVEGAKRGRGRPRKEVAATDGGDGGMAAVPLPFADATNTEAPAGPTFSITNNNRRGAQAAAVAEKAAKAKQEAEELARQAARGWIETMQNGHTTVVLMRARKPKTFADGTVSQRQVKKTIVKNPHAATEASLLARTAKRKAADAAPTAAPRATRKK